MAINVKTGWLNDKDGNKFAPRTLTSQVQTSDGILIEDKIAEEIRKSAIVIDSELSSDSENPVQNKAINAKFEGMSSSINSLNSVIQGMARNYEFHYVNTMDKVSNQSYACQSMLFIAQKGTSDIDVNYPVWIILDGTQYYGRFTGSLIDIRGNHYHCEVSSSVTLGQLRTKGIPIPSDSDSGKYLKGDMTWGEVDISSKADLNHVHDDRYYTESEVDSLLESKAESNHSHDSLYDAKGSADSALSEGKGYTDGLIGDINEAIDVIDVLILGTIDEPISTINNLIGG